MGGGGVELLEGEETLGTDGVWWWLCLVVVFHFFVFDFVILLIFVCV